MRLSLVASLGRDRCLTCNGRSHAEQIALYEGGAHERATLNEQLAAVLGNTAVLLRARLALDVATNTFQYAGGFISYVVVGIALTLGGAFAAIKDPAIFAGTLQMASFLVIMLISGACVRACVYVCVFGCHLGGRCCPARLSLSSLRSCGATTRAPIDCKCLAVICPM